MTCKYFNSYFININLRDIITNFFYKLGIWTPVTEGFQSSMFVRGAYKIGDIGESFNNKMNQL